MWRECFRLIGIRGERFVSEHLSSQSKWIEIPVVEWRGLNFLKWKQGLVTNNSHILLSAMRLRYYE